jgi:DNA mismatch endonuclease (patch repair protein)
VRTRNLDYWVPKIAGNKRRDADTETRLREAGWQVVIVWECEDIEVAADAIATSARRRRATGQ